MTQIEIKAAVDIHIIKYQNYYASVCISYYNGRYLWEDMRQDLYIAFLKVKPERFKPFYDQDRLHFLGGKILGFMFSKRGHKKNHADSSTSTLFETCENYPGRFQDFSDEMDDFDGSPSVDNLIQDEEPSEVAMFVVDMNEALDGLYAYDPFLFDVFTILQRPNESINSLSKKAGINRKFLTDSHKSACEFIRNYKPQPKYHQAG